MNVRKNINVDIDLDGKICTLVSLQNNFIYTAFFLHTSLSNFSYMLKLIHYVSLQHMLYDDYLHKYVKIASTIFLNDSKRKVLFVLKYV